MRATPLCAGVAVLAVAGGPACGAVRDVEASPDFAQWGAAVGSSPPQRRAHEQRVLALVRQGDDAGALGYLRTLSARQPALAVELHETLAGAYLRERRLYRAGQQLDAIPAEQRSDQALYLGAQVAARQQRLEVALTLLERLARRLPDDLRVARDEAQVASLRGRHGQAAAACARVLEQRPGDVEATLLLARTRVYQGRLADAERLLADLAEREPGNGRVALQLGLVRAAVDQPPAARRALARARAIDPSSVAAYVAEAAVALSSGDRVAARALATGALRQNAADPLAGLLEVLSRSAPWSPPVHGDPRFIAAGLFPDLETEPLPAAIRAEIASPVAAGRIALANVLLDHASPAAALAWLGDEPGATVGPLAEATVIRARIAAGQWQVAAARAAALERSAVAQGLAGPSVQSAAIAARGNDGAAARAAMERAVRVNPASPRLRMLAGDLHLAMGAAVLAVPEYRRALRGWPTDARTLNQLAHALAQAGSTRDREEALALTETALAQRPHYLLRAALLDTRADLLFRLGRRGEALQAYRELSTTVGGMTSPEQWHRLGDLAREATDAPLVRRAYEEALDLGRDYPGRADAVRWLDATPGVPARK